MSLDPFELEIIKNTLSSIAEEMGSLLVRASYSPNIKERRDLSCAIFDNKGDMVAQAAHIPVHLGSMSFAVKAVLDELSISEGDVFVLNDPYRGGTHLPDITCIAPVFMDGVLRFFVASRAHHADIGGMTPGSMPLSTSIHDEGIVIPPSKLYDRGRLNDELFSQITHSTRDPEEREGDFKAQIASLELGVKRLKEVMGKYSTSKIIEAASELLNYSERLMRENIRLIPDGVYEFEDFLDDDGSGTEDIPIRVRIKIDGSKATIDFKGTSPQVRGSVNAPLSVTTSAVLYVFQSLAPQEMHLNSGPLRAIEIIAEPGCLLNPLYPAAVSAGNCETSQRVVDVVLGAMAKAIPDRIPAASSGTMNNITFGGVNPLTGREFAYYETIAGGTGAMKGRRGISGKHSHMTNTLNTPIEAIERELPVVIDTYSIRKRSGGRGRFRGGDGIVRSFRFLSNAQVTVITDRRKHPPYGLSGGGGGKPGLNVLKSKGKTSVLPPKATFRVEPGDVLRIETPGGGGWGARTKQNSIER
ncbi:MAG: hydantoinase B/oxoprolinase family protein [Candidatus Caldarchaeum sp.]